MVYELRKNIARNMRYAKENDELDREIGKLSGDISPQANMRREFLQSRRDANYEKMSQPMTENEYRQYDEYGQYLGDSEKEDTDSAWNIFSDGVNHAAQGVTLGWSDEMMGLIGGVGRVAANGILRGLGYSVNGESFSDAWKKGYEDYRDYARQELQKGYERSPAVSSLAEVGGALISPIKIGSGTKGAIGNGIVGGIGMTDENTPNEYAFNIGLNTIGSVAGEKLGNKLNDKIKNISFGLTKLGKASKILTKSGVYGLSNNIYNYWNNNE